MIKVRAAVLEETAFGDRAGDLAQIALRVEQEIPILGGARDDAAVRVDDIGLPGKMVDLFFSHPVGQSGEVAILKGRDLEFRLEKTRRPLPDRACLRDDDKLGALEGEETHVFAEMPVVADGDPDLADTRLKNQTAAISGCIEAALVEPRKIRDLDHAHYAEDAAVFVDHRRRIVGLVAVSFEEVEDGHNPMIPGQVGEDLCRGSGDGLGQRKGVGGGLILRKESEEGQFGEGDK